MEERVLFPEHRLQLSITSESCFDHDQDEHVELKMSPVGDSIMNDKKNKKKKKCKGGPQSPKRIVAFNTSEWLKLDEVKAESKKCTVAKRLSKCATFPARTSPESGEVTKAGTQCAEGSGDSDESDRQSSCTSPDDKMSVLMRCCSLPRKSALRGGFEELGLGPRPKLHVKWALNVFEPPCSTISHTLSHYSSKKDRKQKQRGKTSRDDLYKKQAKKISSKAKPSNESTVHRIEEDFHKVRAGRYLQDKSKEESCTSRCELVFKTELLEEESNCHGSLGNDEIEVACKLRSGKCFEAAEGQTGLLKSGVVDGFQLPNDSKCAGSFLGTEAIQYKLLYGEAV